MEASSGLEVRFIAAKVEGPLTCGSTSTYLLATHQLGDAFLADMGCCANLIVFRDLPLGLPQELLAIHTPFLIATVLPVVSCRPMLAKYHSYFSSYVAIRVFPIWLVLASAC